MIRVLGTKRILLLVMLVALNAALVTGVYGFIGPQKMKRDRDLRSARSQNSKLQEDISRMQIEFDQLQQQQAAFDNLKEKGFLSVQDRRQAERLFVRIGEEAGVANAVVNLQAGQVEDNAEAEKAGYKVLRSSILVKIKTLDDLDVFRYIYLIEKFFPGHISIIDVGLSRKGNVGGAVLRSIASGENPEMVDATISMEWRTMIPQSSVIEAEKGARQ